DLPVTSGSLTTQVTSSLKSESPRMTTGSLGFGSPTMSRALSRSPTVDSPAGSPSRLPRKARPASPLCSSRRPDTVPATAPEPNQGLDTVGLFTTTLECVGVFSGDENIDEVEVCE